MPIFWNPQIDTAEWIDRDLTFEAFTEAGSIRYVVRAHRLRDAAQRTCAEALLHNLPHLRRPLQLLACDAVVDDIIWYD